MSRSVIYVENPHTDHQDASDEIQHLQPSHTCKRRAEEDDVPLCQICHDERLAHLG